MSTFWRRYQFRPSSTIVDPIEPPIPSLPDGLNILSWNYDLQLERAFRGFVKRDSDVMDAFSNSGRVFRLNGSCIGRATYPEVVTPESSNPLGLVYGGFQKETVDKINEFYKDIIANRIDTGLRFAWEIHSLDSEVERIARNTSILVACGYSFPYFNRGIDGTILDVMKNNNLETIYVQAKEDQEEVMQRIRTRIIGNASPRVVHVEPTTGVQQFFIPSEME